MSISTPDGFSDRRTPRHVQVRDSLAQDIGAGVYAPGEQLPSERTLCERLNVSRLTLRRGLKSLVSEGLLESSPGRGWFVAEGAIGEPANALLSFSEMAHDRGLTPRARVISRSVRAATIDEAETLLIAPGSRLFELQRLRMLDDVPIGISHSRIPVSLAPDLIDLDFEEASLYAALRLAGTNPARAEAVIEAVPADEEQAGILAVAVGDPLLRLSQITVREDGHPIEIGVLVYRGDRYRFHAKLTSPRRRRERSVNESKGSTARPVTEATR